MVTDLGREGLDSRAQLVYLDDETGEGEGLLSAPTMLCHQGSKLRPTIEGVSPYSCTHSHTGEGDLPALGRQLHTGLLNPANEFSAHCPLARLIKRSRRSTRLRWRVASSPQPRASASRANASESARWVAKMGRKVDSVRKFGQCSQMFV